MTALAKGGRALVCAPLPPEYDQEAGSQRIYHTITFLLEAGMRVAFVCEKAAGRIKIMAEGLHGRALAYREALSGGETPLAEVLRRNAYGGTPPQDSEAVARLEAYVRNYAKSLGSTARNELIK